MAYLLQCLKKLSDSPVQLLLAFLVPMLFLQLFGVPTIAALIESKIFPASRSMGVARIGLAPIASDPAGLSDQDIPWSELLLLTHSAPGPRDFELFSSRSKILGVSAGAMEPTPNLRQASTVDPRRIPLLKVRLPQKKLFAAVVHTASSEDGTNAETKFWLEGEQSVKHISRPDDSIVTMSKNEYWALTASYIFSVLFASVASLTLRNAPALQYPEAAKDE